ncbi:NFYB/HAP3 family transcription factor subunit [Candidatus Woesearchaeota archaeon]|nr:NFYB/HAP3 family transcription factor subunit [Candidatus Woesearchaeota archaeon]
MERLSAKLIERVLKRERAIKISKEAKEEFEKLIIERIREIAVLAVRNASLFGRKTVKKEDVIAAQKRMS